MKLFQFKKNDNVQVGIELDNTVYNFSAMDKKNGFVDLQTMINEEMFNVEYINDIINSVKDEGTLESYEIKEEIDFDIPVRNPQKILCFGVNYVAHAEEGDNPIPDEPIMFSKTNNTLLPHNGTITFPKNIGRVDHEIELALVIGKKGRNIKKEDGLDYVAGYTIINDISARKMQIEDLDKGHPWLRSKSYDTFCPIGPYLTPAGAVNNPYDIDLTLKINDVVKQHSNTSRMIFKIPELIEFASGIMTLMSGDIICTGTPEGISEIKDGDIVTCELSGLGILSNSVKSV